MDDSRRTPDIKRSRKMPPADLLRKAVEVNAGIVTLTAKALNVDPSTVTRWKSKFTKVEEMFGAAKFATLDLAEAKVVQAIQAGKTAEIIFYLKCHGKHRGWIERSEVETIVRPDVRAELEKEQTRLRDPKYREALQIYFAAKEEADRPEPKKAMAVVLPMPPRGQS